MNTSVNITVDLLITNFVVGFILPLLVDLLAKWKAPAKVKIIINLIISAIAGVLTPLVIVPHVAWQAVVLSILQVFVTSMVSHANLLKPAGITGDFGAILKAIPGGIGVSETKPAASDDLLPEYPGDPNYIEDPDSGAADPVATPVPASSVPPAPTPADGTTPGTSVG